MNKKPLPELPDEVFDGEKFSVEVNKEKCSHKNVKLIDNVIYCSCGACWTGPQIERLYEAFKKRK